MNISQHIKCEFGWHEYTKWEHAGFTEVKIHNNNHKDGIIEKTYEVQKRECVHCGIKKMRRERQ